jgi:CheY-like chemotaxis protein
VKLPAEPVHLHADPARLEQIFGNLLSNACKYTPAGGTGRISITALRDGTAVTVSVRDNGVGIPVIMLDEVFRMFAQVEASLERSRGGLGIGLSLVKSLAEMHGGRVEARSDGPGTGSEFLVRLPVASSDAMANGASGRDAPGTKPAVTGQRILVIDDNRDAAETLASLLQLTGNLTFMAHDGLEAISAALSFKPDIVLLDIGLPKLNGYQVAQRIRAEPWGKEMSLIAVTGWGQEEDRRKAMDAGFNAHVVKPVDYVALMNVLASLGAQPRAKT